MIASPPRQDRIVLRSPLFAENATVFLSQEQVKHTKHRKGGEDVAVFLRGSLANEGVAVLMEDFSFLAGEEDTRVLVEGLVVLKGDLTTVSTKEMVVLSIRLEGEKEGAPVQFPPDRRPAKPLADACCCASMQRSVASADIIVMEGWGRKG